MQKYEGGTELDKMQVLKSCMFSKQEECTVASFDKTYAQFFANCDVLKTRFDLSEKESETYQYMFLINLHPGMDSIKTSIMSQEGLKFHKKIELLRAFLKEKEAKSSSDLYEASYMGLGKHPVSRSQRQFLKKDRPMQDEKRLNSGGNDNSRKKSSNVCYNYREYGKCFKGDKCMFQHDDTNQDSSSIKSILKAKEDTQESDDQEENGSSQFKKRSNIKAANLAKEEHYQEVEYEYDHYSNFANLAIDDKKILKEKEVMKGYYQVDEKVYQSNFADWKEKEKQKVSVIKSGKIWQIDEMKVPLDPDKQVKKKKKKGVKEQ